MIHLEVDFYSKFKLKGFVDPQHHFIDLWKYYDAFEGWKNDKIPQVINLLSKLRFFNRFPDETLNLMIKQVTLKTLKKGHVLYLNKNEAVIVLTGKIHMMSYQKDLLCPHVSRLYHPGDIIGLPAIDSGWSTAEHSWPFTMEDCDLFYISTAYLSFLWD